MVVIGALVVLMQQTSEIEAYYDQQETELVDGGGRKLKPTATEAPNLAPVVDQ